jgi:diguanylate cyclase (GGDEF)-like protein|tara:strand:+ start:31212 stop:32195 length:984 start_codon:yes stop_codon:yes gene_type:complete
MESINQIAARPAFEASPLLPHEAGLCPLELYDRAASLLPMGAFSCDLHSERLTWTDGVFSMFGLCSRRQPERRAMIDLYSEESRDLLERKRAQAIATCSGFSLDAQIVRPDGAERWIRITAAVNSRHGRAETLYGMKQDISEDRARWEALRAQAECDPLTGVANRARFQNFLDQAQNPPQDGAAGETSVCANIAAVGALILFDLDRFKQVNDWWGHAAGDACLVALGDRLRKAFPQARLISRIGGDEFAVLLPPVESRSKTEAKVRFMLADLLRPVPWNGDLLPFSASVGLAFAPQAEALDPHALFVAADRALYAAKENERTALIRA